MTNKFIYYIYKPTVYKPKFMMQIKSRDIIE